MDLYAARFEQGSSLTFDNVPATYALGARCLSLFLFLNTNHE